MSGKERQRCLHNLTLATIVLLGIAGATFVAAQSTVQTSRPDLIRTVIHNELSTTAQEVRWKYMLDKEVDGKQGRERL
jgi:hypothetical protein